MSVDLKSIVINMKGKTDTGIGFVLDDGGELFFTYDEVYGCILKMLSKLLASGIERGDTVIFQIGELKEFVFAFWACIIGDMIPVPIDKVSNKGLMNLLCRISSADSSYVIYDDDCSLSDIKNKICICSYMNCETAQFSTTTEENQIAYIQYSSGSTGTPKGVVLTHENIIANTEAIIKKVGISVDDIGLSWLPLTHDMGLIGFHIIPAYLHANHYLMPTRSFIIKPEMWIHLIDKYAVTLTGAPNFALEHIVKRFEKTKTISDDYSLASLRILFNGSESISVDAINRFYDFFGKKNMGRRVVYPVYGLTEATLAVAFPEEHSPIEIAYIDVNLIKVGERVCFGDENRHAAIVSVGKPLDGVVVTIRNDNYDLLGNLIYGHICVSGKSVASHYVVDNQLVPINNHEFLDTGDIGFYSNDKLYIIGRENEIVINGKNFYLSDAEAIIKNAFKQQGVDSDAFLVPLYDARNTEIVLMINGQYSLAVMQVLERTKGTVFSETAMSIHSVLFVSEIPYTNSGKVKRLEMRCNCATNSYPNNRINLYHANELDSLNDTEHIVIDLFQQTFGFRPHWNDNLINYELNSIDLYIFLAQIEECINAHVEINQVWSCNTLRDLYNCIIHAK